MFRFRVVVICGVRWGGFGSVWFASVQFDSLRFGGEFPLELELGE